MGNKLKVNDNQINKDDDDEHFLTKQEVIDFIQKEFKSY